MAEEQRPRQRQPHALVIFFPMQSHANPMLTLARRMQALGFSITAVISESYDSSTVAAMGFSAVTYPDPRIDEDNAMAFFTSEQWSIRVPIEQVAQGLQSELSCIVFDVSSAWVPALASKLHLPSIGLLTIPVSCILLYDNLALLIAHLSQGVEDGHVEDGHVKPDFCIPGLLPLGLHDIPAMMSSLQPSSPMLDFTLQSVEDMFNATWVVMNSFEELEHDALQALRSRRPNTMAIGPLLPINDQGARLVANCWRDDSFCLQWLNRHHDSSVLYVSFGSVSRMSIEQVEQLVHGLEASKQPFLWVCRPDFIKNVSDGYLEHLSRTIKDQGLIISWAPQLEVLRHRAIGGFLTHCGWNSTIESVSMGIPMIAWPFRAEQHLNCKYIIDKWRVGVRISSNELIEKDEICSLIRKLMQGKEAEEMRMRARYLGIAASAAVKKGGSSYCNLQGVAKVLLESLC